MGTHWKTDKNLVGKMKQCECGCGELIPVLNSVYRPLRFKKNHAPKTFPKRDKSHKWEGGRFIDKTHGYVFVKNWDHPFASKEHYIEEHRLVWEQHHNAMLLPWALVHHINEVKTDNRIDNLEAMMKNRHWVYHKLIPIQELSKRSCALCGGKTKGVQRKFKIVQMWYSLDGKKICYWCYHRRYRTMKNRIRR